MQNKRSNISNYLSFSAVTHTHQPSQTINNQTYKNQFPQFSKKYSQKNSENQDLAFLRNTVGSGSSNRYQYNNRYEYNNYKQNQSKGDNLMRQTTSDAKQLRDKLRLSSPLQVTTKGSSSKQTDNRLDFIMQKYQKKNETKQAFKLLDQLKQLKKKQQELKSQRKREQSKPQNSKLQPNLQTSKFDTNIQTQRLKLQHDLLNSPLNFSKKNKVQYYTPKQDKKQQTASIGSKHYAFSPQNANPSISKYQRNVQKYDKNLNYDHLLSYQRQNKYPPKLDNKNKQSIKFFSNYSSSSSQQNNKHVLQNSPILKQSVQQFKLIDSSYQGKSKNSSEQQNNMIKFSTSMVTNSYKNKTINFPNKKLTDSSTYKLLNSKFQNEPFKDRKLNINDFILGKSLGEGKFGIVYQAYDKITKSLFALKKVPKEIIKSHWMTDQFVLQIKLQSFLNHQNILGLFTCFDDSTHIYIVLQYMQEGTLFFLLKKNATLTENEAALKLRQIAAAVKYMHQNGIAHRDIKPENIVMSHGVCKLCDFGWATICDERRKTYCGTFDYAAPQILQGTQYDMSVDLWCLGILAYQIMVGKAPFYHVSRKQTMKKIMNCQQQKIMYPTTMSKQAKSFIQSLIKKNPQQRLKSEDLLQHPFLKYASETNLK